MVTDGTTLVMGFAAGDVTVGSDHCQTVRWIHYNEDGTVAEALTPSTRGSAKS